MGPRKATPSPQCRRLLPPHFLPGPRLPSRCRSVAGPPPLTGPQESTLPVTGALSRVPGARIILPGSSRVSAASSLRSGQFWEPRRLNLKDIGVEAPVTQSSSDPPRSHKVGDFFLPRPRLPHGGTDLLALVPRTPLPVHTRSWKWGRTSRRLLLQAPSLMAPADTKP